MSAKPSVTPGDRPHRSMRAVRAPCITGVTRTGVAAAAAAASVVLAVSACAPDQVGVERNAASVKAAKAVKPVYASDFPDPGVVKDGNRFVAYSTSGHVNAAVATKASGPWTPAGAVLPTFGAWADNGKAAWAPSVVKTSAGWVMYYSAVPRGGTDQRCIGVATAAAATGPFTASAKPLICPGRKGTPDVVAGRPVAKAGVIDPAPFKASDGTRYVVYKTQQTPSSIRMFQVSSDGRSGAGHASRELVQRDGIIENPVMVQKSAKFLLFASRYGWNNCSYATVWMRSTNRWKWSGLAEHSLMTSKATGLCGPGGADITPGLDGGTGIFFHAWTCGSSRTSPCTTANVECTPSATRKCPIKGRALYAGVLGWGSDGATPRVSKILLPGE